MRRDDLDVAVGIANGCAVVILTFVSAAIVVVAINVVRAVWF